MKPIPEQLRPSSVRATSAENATAAAYREARDQIEAPGEGPCRCEVGDQKGRLAAQLGR
jgi:hypothetical protein